MTPKPHDPDSLADAIKAEPCRVWSLWDIMKVFEAKNLHKRIGEFVEIEIVASTAANALAGRGVDALPISEDLRVQSENLRAEIEASFLKCIRTALPDLRTSGMADAVRELERLAKVTSRTQNNLGAMQANAQTARWAITNEMDKRKFLYVPIHLSDFVDNDALFGQPVWEKFKSARGDVREVGNCLAADCNTAAVFHLMRVSEYGLRAVARRVRVKLTDKGVSQPLEYADWTKVIRETRGKITSLRALSAGHKKDTQLAFYADVIEQFDHIKDVWRNTVSHARQSYNADEAMGVMRRVKDLMIRIANGPG